MPKGETVNNLFQRLSDNGIEVISLRNKSNRLEEFFMRLVSQSNEAEQTQKVEAS